jgi:hypothetical protein
MLLLLDAEILDREPPSPAPRDEKIARSKEA